MIPLTQPPSRSLRPRAAALAPLLALSLLALASAPAAAEGTPGLAVVDLQRVVQAIPAGQAAAKQLKAMAVRETRKVAEERAKIAEELEKLQASAGSMADKHKQVAVLQERQEKLKAQGHGVNDKVTAEQTRLLAPVLAEVGKAVAAVAKDKGYALVLRMPLAGVVYSAKGATPPDITDLVIARFAK
jgi:Skp family chaperone for outer membrane proteins